MNMTPAHRVPEGSVRKLDIYRVVHAVRFGCDLPTQRFHRRPKMRAESATTRRQSLLQACWFSARRFPGFALRPNRAG